MGFIPEGVGRAVAAGLPPAVERGILPRGMASALEEWNDDSVLGHCSGRRDAALNGPRDACRYALPTSFALRLQWPLLQSALLFSTSAVEFFIFDQTD